MTIVYYTSGITGFGRLVRGIAVGNALKRNNLTCEFTILSSSKFAYLCDPLGIKHSEIPIENEIQLSKKNYHKSVLFNTLAELKPDILIIDMLWFSLYHFIEEFKCKKVFITNNTIDNFFTIKLPEETIKINPGHYDRMLAVEPYNYSIPVDPINPIVLRNRDEILSREDAAIKLGVDASRETCLFAFNNNPDDFDKFKKKYSYLENVYKMIFSTNYRGGIFPAVDYFNAFDFIVSGAGYNMFWEVVYFRKEAAFENVKTLFSRSEYRIEKCRENFFDINGGDQLVDIMINL